MNGRRWSFGRGQTRSQEGREIDRAKAAGLTEPYMAGQRWARMIDAERERRRERKRAGLGAGPWRTLEDAAWTGTGTVLMTAEVPPPLRGGAGT